LSGHRSVCYGPFRGAWGDISQADTRAGLAPRMRAPFEFVFAPQSYLLRTRVVAFRAPRCPGGVSCSARFSGRDACPVRIPIVVQRLGEFGCAISWGTDRSAIWRCDPQSRKESRRGGRNDRTESGCCRAICGALGVAPHIDPGHISAMLTRSAGCRYECAGRTETAAPLPSLHGGKRAGSLLAWSCHVLSCRASGGDRSLAERRRICSRWN